MMSTPQLDLLNVLEKEGVEYEVISYHTPQHNDIVEKKYIFIEHG